MTESLYTTTDKQRIKVYEIAAEMEKAYGSEKPIEDIVHLALEYEGAYELMDLWIHGDDEALDDLIELVKENEQ